jgi:hypothetical protein
VATKRPYPCRWPFTFTNCADEYVHQYAASMQRPCSTYLVSATAAPCQEEEAKQRKWPYQASAA